MPNSIIPTQIGNLPFDPNHSNISTIVLGKDNTAGVTFEAIGLGTNGRPDSLESIKINFSKFNTGSESYRPLGSATLNVEDIYNFFTGNLNVVQNLEIKFRQVSVCEINDTTNQPEERYMLVLASQTFASGQGNASRTY